MGIPLVRFDRIYPPHTDDIIWCKDYDDAIQQLQSQKINRLLALTGVQTIGRLRNYWQQNDCWMRILDRNISREIAQREGFPADRLVYYTEEDNRTQRLIQQVHPQAILTKESGLSGGFNEKVEAAKAAGVKIFVVERPRSPLPAPRSSITPNTQHPTPNTHHPSPNTHHPTPIPQVFIVNGPHGLRRKVEQLLPSFFPLKTGLTTGTCATAAAIAALTGLRCVQVRLPNGEDIDVEVAHVEPGKASVIKYAGDDPDMTDGLEICAEVKSLHPTPNTQHPSPNTHHPTPITILGGEGVGRVTLPGLGLPIGSAAINEVPQQMIRENLRLCLHRSPLTSLLPLEGELEGVSSLLESLVVTISVPKGREVAAQTFNPRIGVVDGISIIGTSGIVRPLSSDAWISSIRKEMSVGLAVVKGDTIVINSGAKSERFLRQHLPHLPEQAFIHYGNFIGETLRIADELITQHLPLEGHTPHLPLEGELEGVSTHHLAPRSPHLPLEGELEGVPRSSKIIMGVMIGKAVKLAEGHVNTHSHQVTMNRDFLLQLATEACLTEAACESIKSLNMARELWDILPADDMRRLAHVIIDHCHRHCAPLLPHGKLSILLISEKGEIFE